MEYLELILKCMLFYAVIVCALRIMGKREVGELSILDMVVYFVMSEILALTISEPSETIGKALVAIVTLVLLQMTVAWVCLKLKGCRDFFEGKPSVLVENGIINQQEMRRQRYTLDDLLYQLRDKEISSLEEVQYAILENSGVLTILEKDSSKLLYPFPLISDGVIQKESLKKAGVEESWLKNKLSIEGCKSEKEVFLCMIQKNGLFILKKKDHKQHATDEKA